MKKVFVLLGLGLMTMFNAQTVTKPALDQGSYSVGLNSTGLGFSTTVDSGVRNTNLGVEMGYFVEDKLQVLGGVGYTNVSVKDLGTVSDRFNYLAGVKYYLNNVIPMQVDFNGDDNGNEYVGLQAGYAFFPSSNFSVEPSARFDFATESDRKDIFGLKIGFNYFF